MSTSNDLTQIERMLDKKQAVPSQMIRALVAYCRALIINIGTLKAEKAELEGQLEIERSKNKKPTGIAAGNDFTYMLNQQVKK